MSLLTAINDDCYKRVNKYHIISETELGLFMKSMSGYLEIHILSNNNLNSNLHSV